MAIGRINDDSFLKFGKKIDLLTEDLRFLQNYNCEEKSFQKSSNVYISNYETYIECIGGQGLFTCSFDLTKENFSSFCLNTPLKLKENIYFSFVPLTEDFKCSIYYKDELEIIKNIMVDFEFSSVGTKCTKLYSVSMMNFKDGIVFRPDTQPYWEMIYYSGDGQINIKIGDLKFKVPSESLFFIPKKTVHCMTTDKFNVNLLSTFFELECSQWEKLLNPIKVTSQIKYYIERIIEKYNFKNLNSEDAILYMISLIVLEALDINENIKKNQNISIGASVQMNEIMNEAEKLIKENIFNPKLNVKFVAENLFISQSYLYRCAKVRYKYGLSEYIKNEKLKIAKNMIASGCYSFSYISENLNFCSQSYFSTEFKKKFGMTPITYAKQFNIK